MRTRPLALAATLALPVAIALTGCSGSDGASEGASGDPISVKASDTACEVSRAEAPAGQRGVHDHELRQQGQRVLRLRRGRPDHGRGRERRARPDPHLPRRPVRAGHLPDRLQAGDGGRRHPRAVHRHRGVGRGQVRRREPRGGRHRVPALRRLAVRRVPRRDHRVRRARQGRQGRRGQGALPDGPVLLGADRAGGGVVRRPRPEDRRPRGGRRRGHGVHRLPPPREGPVGGRPAARLARPSPTSCSPTSPSSSTKAKAVELNPLQLANGSKALLDEIATGKITGEEERYSHTDLWDFEANFEGSKSAIAALRPFLQAQDPALVTTIDTTGKALGDLLETYRDRDGFVLYPALTPADIKKLTEALDAFSEPVATVAGVVARGERLHPAGGPRHRRGRGPRRGRRRADLRRSPGLRRRARRSRMPPTRRVVPFRGERQAGITTAAQDRLHLVALDVITDDPEALRDLLTRWTVAAERMTLGAEAAPGGVVGGGPWNVPQDTGEALDLAPGHLTVTIGYGPTLFDDRFGLADRRPEALRELPALPRRRPRPGALGRRHRHPGLLGRPPGRGARGAQPGADGLRRRRGALEPARLRPHVVDVAGAGDAAQHVRLQGRHREHQVRGHRRPRPARVGRARRTCPARRRGWPAAPTSWRGGSGCTSRSGTAPR